MTVGNNYPNEPSRVVTDEELPYCPHCQRSFNEEAGGDEPVAVRYDGDGYGYRYIDNGSGSDWLTRHKDGEPLYDRPQRALEQPAQEGWRPIESAPSTTLPHPQPARELAEIESVLTAYSLRPPGVSTADAVRYAMQQLHVRPQPARGEVVAWARQSGDPRKKVLNENEQ